MLKNLIELGRDVQIKFENFNNWQELSFNTKDKEELAKLDNVKTVLSHSIIFEFDTNHAIIPSQYILYALSIKDFALGLKEHLDFFDLYKSGKDRNQIGDEIKNQTFDRTALNLDAYSQTVLMEPIINNHYNFGAKSIINGEPGDYKVRGTSDFFASVILKIINVPDASSSMLGKLIFHLADNPDLYYYLESRFIEYLPYLVQDSKIKSFAKKTFAYLTQYDGLIRIKEFIFKNSDQTFSSIKLNDIGLTSIFRTSQILLSEDDLKQGGKPRYYSDPIFIIDNEFYYFSTEWTNGTDSRLDLESLISILDLTYPEFKIKKEGSLYQLISSSIKINISKVKQEKFSIERIFSDFNDSGLRYSDQLITRFISSLTTKPFVLLSGLSGSGKTKLAEAFAKWICESDEQYTLIPVGADWTNREPLLGYVNALEDTKYILPENGALDLLIKANINQEKPYFLILDEMNLSHVERYFADFLSVMESKESFKLHSSDTNLNSNNIEKYDKFIEVPKELEWPANLFVVGTVNIDETTYMFSPKVLDRANVIEFRVSNNDLENYLKPETKPLDMKKLWEVDSKTGLGAKYGKNFVKIAIENIEKENIEHVNTELRNFFKELQEIGAEFGYRTASEIQTLFGKIDLIYPNYYNGDGFFEKYVEKDDFKIDVAIMQKLLPKLHGSRNKLASVLKLLAKLCLEKDDFSQKELEQIFKIVKEGGLGIKYPISYKKIERMYDNVVANGFTSYAEA